MSGPEPMVRFQLSVEVGRPDERFMRQVGRTLTAADEGVLVGHRVLICDRDAKWSAPVRDRLGEAGIRVVQTPFQAPNANAYAERFVRSIKHECLNRVIPFGERHLRRTIAEFVEHYHRERNHQGLGNEFIEGRTHDRWSDRIRRRSAARRAPQLLLSRSVMRREDRFDGSAQRWDTTGWWSQPRRQSPTARIANDLGHYLAPAVAPMAPSLECQCTVMPSVSN